MNSNLVIIAGALVKHLNEIDTMNNRLGVLVKARADGHSTIQPHIEDLLARLVSYKSDVPKLEALLESVK